MNELQTINDVAITVKEHMGVRVVTFKDIDAVHGRPDGTARRNFNTNKSHLIEGEDYFNITPDEFRTAIPSVRISDGCNQTDEIRRVAA